MDEYITLSGYLSVIGALDRDFRDVYFVKLDRERYEKIKTSKLRRPEQAQYRRIFAACKKKQIEIRFCPPEEFVNIRNSGGIAAAVSERRFSPVEDIVIDESSFIVFLDGIEDPYNFGYILRSLYLSGVTAVIIPKPRQHFFGEITARSSAGLSETMEIAACDKLDLFCGKLKEQGVRVVCSALKDSISMYDSSLKKPLMLIIGGERRGISSSILSLADEVVRIDYGKEKNISLPAVSAASVLAFEVYRKNR